MSEFTIDVLDPGDARWQSSHEQCRHDVYSSPTWCRLHESVDGGDAMAILATRGRESVLMPAIRRPLEGDRWDATSPYGYSGLLTTRPNDPGFLDDALTAMTNVLREAGCVSAFVRLHPLLNTEPLASADMVVEHGPTVVVDLRESADAWWRLVRKGHRSDIERSRRLGVTAERVDDAGSIGAFVEMYSQTMSRLDASAYYRQPAEYFQALILGLEEVELWVARLEGVPIAGSMFSLSPASGIAQYLYSATDNAYRRLQPSKLILSEFIARTCSTDTEFLHLGGGLGAREDGLFDFKRGFGGTVVPFRTARFVIDHEEYRSRTAAVLGSAPAAHDRVSGFFPAYRSLAD